MLKLTRKASADLDEIFEHYKVLVGAEQAKTIVHEVVAESNALNQAPRLADSRPAEVPAVREVALKRWPFLTCFQVTPGAVEILRFLHRNGQPINQPVYRKPVAVVASQLDIADLRCYDKQVDGFTYRVPRGINRDARGAVWVVRAVRNKENKLLARFSDETFGNTLRALEAAIIHLKYSGYAWLGGDVLQLDERATVHWRKRSGVGLCAVSYVTSNNPGRGETFFVSTHKRVESGKGMLKFRAKLMQTLECSHAMEHGASTITDAARAGMSLKIDELLQSEDFQTFLLAGKRKADQIAVDAYKDSLE